MGTSVILSFFSRLDIDSETEYSWLYPIIIEFWMEKFWLEEGKLAFFELP